VHRAIRFQPPAVLPDVRCVFGEILLCDIIASRADLGLLDPPDDFLPELPLEWLQRQVTMFPAHAVKLWQSRAFFKPANDKVFQRGVYERGADVPLRHVSQRCPVLISEVVNFDLEVRLYCLDGVVRTAAPYLMIDEDEASARDAGAEFGQRFLDRFADRLPSGVVLDVGRIEGGKWCVIEANQAYASGIYQGADTQAVLDVVQRAAGPMGSVSEKDRKFLRERIVVE
jgi:hypothetical protein